MFGPTIRFPTTKRLELHGTPLWIPAILLTVCGFSVGLAWVFLQAGELWSEVGMGRMLRRPDPATGHYVSSTPTALMTLGLGLPWLLALSQVHLRSVVLDATQDCVFVRPIGPLGWPEHRLWFDQIAAVGVEEVPTALPLRLIGRSRPGARPVLQLTDGDTVPLARQRMDRAQAEKIEKMADKVLRRRPTGR